MSSMCPARQGSFLRLFGETRLALLGAAVALSTGCAGRTAEASRLAPADAGSRSAGTPAARTGDEERSSRLVVENAHFHHVRVSLLRNGAPVSIGTVGSMERRAFRLPVRLIPRVGGLSVRVVSPVDRRVWESLSVPVERGESVHVEVGLDLLRSAVSVWP